MAKDVNRVSLIGRLTRDPEMSYTKTNTAVAKFAIANNGMKQDDVSFFNITVWDKLATVCSQYIKKGSQVYISGSLKQDRYTDKEGNNKYSISITAYEVQFLGGKSTSGDKSNAGNDNNQNGNNTGTDFDFG